MIARNIVLFWIGAALVFALLIYAFSPILLPFVAGMALAYLLDPVADRLERLGLPRVWATAVIMVLVLAVAVLIAVLLLPVLVGQLAAFAANVPAYASSIEQWLTHAAGTKLFRALNIKQFDFQNSLGTLMSSGSAVLTTLVSSVWSGGQTLVSVVSLMVVTPVVAFYLLVDWDRMIGAVDGTLPLAHRDTVRALARDMDATVASFVRGQVASCVLLGLFYGVSLSLAGLRFGLLIGLFAGLVSFIPYLGTISGGALAIGLAFYQFWPDPTFIAVVVGIFVVGQFLEGYVLQPMLIGSSVGLHPVWLMFALFAFGAALGFLGLLIAVPTSACIAVLVRFALSQYRQSILYNGRPEAGAPTPSAPADPETRVSR